MEILYNGFTLEFSQGAFPLSTDSLVLAHFARLPKNATVLDLGSGCGTLGLLLCAKDSGCTVTGIELDSDAHEMALHNIRKNHLEDRLTSICGDIADLPSHVRPGQFSCCISNPPYFSAGPKSKTVPYARRDDFCDTHTLMAAASHALRYGSDFFLVHRPEKLAELCACGSSHMLEAKRLCLLRHRSNGPVTLVLMQFRKGGKPGLKWEEAALFDAADRPTPYYNTLYHLSTTL